jgi:hypothetical protein
MAYMPGKANVIKAAITTTNAAMPAHTMRIICPTREGLPEGTEGR